MTQTSQERTKGKGDSDKASAVGATEITGTQRIDAQARSRRIKMRFYQSSATDYFKIQAPIELMYKAGGTRG